MKQIKALNKPVVLLLFNGSALALNWEKKNFDAILEAWYPGQASGTAIADILFGDYNPAGRLPVTFYKSVNDLPDFEDYDMQNRTYRYFQGDPLFEFGFGLSYTNFEYKNIKLNRESIDQKTSCTVEVEIQNTGNYDGEEVLQLYISKKSGRFTRPIKELKAFQRVFITRGNTKTVRFTIAPSDLVFYDENGSEILEPGDYEILLGASSEDIRLRHMLNAE
jgi:beta-glucosidase